MQNTSNQATLPSQLVDILTKFFHKSFENDPNFSMFVKEWNIFKEMISKESIDMNTVFLYIAMLQLNLEKNCNSKKLEPIKKINLSPSPLRRTEEAAIDYKSILEEESKKTKTPKVLDNILHKYKSQSSNLISIPIVSEIVKSDSKKTYENMSVKKDNQNTIQNHQSISNLSSINIDSNKIQSSYKNSVNIQMLIDKSKYLNQEIDSHNEKIINMIRSKTNPEGRTPLRTIMVYMRHTSQESENKGEKIFKVNLNQLNDENLVYKGIS